MTSVLLAMAQPPFTEGGASGRTAVALLRGLRRHGLDVRGLAPIGPGEVSGAPDDLGVELVPVEPPARGGWRGLAARARRPVGELCATDFGERARQLARDVDVVHLDQIETACLGPLGQRPTLLQVHYRALLDVTPRAPWRHSDRYQLELAAAERRAARRYRWLLVNASDVARSLSGGQAHVGIAPTPIDPDDYAVAPPAAEPVAGLVGTAHWPPTASAIRHLQSDIWPLVARAVPDARLRVAGRGTEHLRSDQPSVEIVGPVSSAGDFLRGLAVLVYAAHRGSGTKIKVVEALTCGVPVVTTPPGAEGIAANDGLLVASTAAEFAEQTRRLLLDPAERAERGRAARQYIEQRHAPLPATAPIVELYERMLSAGT